MTKKMGIEWRLPQLMHQQHLHSSSALIPLLAERGIHLSRMQVYRLMTEQPLRLSMDLLAALCDIFACTPNDLIEVKVVREQVHKKAVGEKGTVGDVKPLRVSIRRPHE